MIPLVDLNAQYLSIKSEIDEAINSVLAKSDFIRGEAVFRFENEFAKYIGTDYCIGCGNGTDALELILKALKIGPGDEVIVPALTWIATAEAVVNVGARPVFADINKYSYTLDTEDAEKRITPKTKAVIPVHLYGNSADMAAIADLAGRNNLFLVEDCAQAHGAEYLGKKIGSFGIASAFSFYPGKNLGAYGDAGAVVTNSEDLAQEMRMLSNHGQTDKKNLHFVSGRNSRLDTIQAAVLSVKLKYLDKWNLKRTEAARYYISKLGHTDYILPDCKPDTKHVYHLFTVRVKNREKLMERFSVSGIACAIHYPKPLDILDPFYDSSQKTCEVASLVTQEILSIPLFPEITAGQQDSVSDILFEHYKG